ncbi:DUF1761 domain-containing protein [Roseovarius aestuarii]|uniref:DUF1761 domain-containing protein n=1 Tax=Roseovarius aestuarii TaxID=475083 RepID=A0A1X7BR46_9RHOB|nr:DUF1761 domain-containing protein [Roseovarius aestuarii]SMC12068.1 hypothetical protein ROA7745_01891 [Roseovarius aestuarii]
MELLNVLVAAVASYAFGAAWYMTLAKPWMEAAGVKAGPDGKPEGNSPTPYIIAFISALVVAGMMRHVFALSGIDTIAKGLVAGLGIGLFLASPWLATCYSFGGRPFRLTMIDAGYATFGSAIMGTVLMLF